MIDILTCTRGNRGALRDAHCESCERHLRATGGGHAARKVTIDIDSFPILVHGQQPGAPYNGHYRETVYHPLLASYSMAGKFQQAIGPQLSLLAFNLASTLRIEYEATAGSCCDLRRFGRDVLKAGGRVVKHARRLTLYVVRVVSPCWERLVACLRRWRLPPRFPAPRGPSGRDGLPPPPRHAFASEVRRQ